MVTTRGFSISTRSFNNNFVFARYTTNEREDGSPPTLQTPQRKTNLTRATTGVEVEGHQFLAFLLSPVVFGLHTEHSFPPLLLLGGHVVSSNPPRHTTTTTTTTRRAAEKTIQRHLRPEVAIGRARKSKLLRIFRAAGTHHPHVRLVETVRGVVSGVVRFAQGARQRRPGRRVPRVQLRRRRQRGHHVEQEARARHQGDAEQASFLPPERAQRGDGHPVREGRLELRDVGDGGRGERNRRHPAPDKMGPEEGPLRLHGGKPHETAEGVPCHVQFGVPAPPVFTTVVVAAAFHLFGSAGCRGAGVRVQG
jgi:hypothetical protein